MWITTKLLETSTIDTNISLLPLIGIHTDDSWQWTLTYSETDVLKDLTELIFIIDMPLYHVFDKFDNDITLKYQ